MDITLGTNLREVLGGKTAQVLAKSYQLTTVRDLLMHFPYRYAVRGELSKLSDLRVGEQATIVAEVVDVKNRRMRNRKGSLTEVVVTDGTDELELTFFNQPWREKTLGPGRVGLFAGKVNKYRNQLQLANPECVMMPDGMEDDQEAAMAFASEVIPVYRATGSLPSWRIAQSVRIILDQLDWADYVDPLPPELLAQHKLLPAEQAFRAIHQPANEPEGWAARTRFKWEEALALQLVLESRRIEAQAGQVQVIERQSGGLLDVLDARIPFELTDGQVRVDSEIEADMSSGVAMHRLLQGEVGSGKTLVALRAMLSVVDSGGQAALLAPTEVLAQQHYDSILEFLGSAGIGGTLMGDAGGTQVVLVTGSQKAAQRREALAHIASGAAGIIVGTHALLEDQVIAADLGLVVIDEQHRFGVEQRARLIEKATNTRPHVLVMTATPIPRTIAMTVFGDLDVSTLDELPQGRQEVSTHVVPKLEKPEHYRRVWERIREEIDQGRQAFVVCTRIADSEGPSVAEQRFTEDYLEIDPEAERPEPVGVLQVADELTNGPLKGLRVGVMHGQMPAAEKEAIMAAFRGDSSSDGKPELDVLVATTIVEVGVDVPNATVMVIMDADRLGLSQLHQLRGRVGRGEHAGLCLLVTQVSSQSTAYERLDEVTSTNDGFTLAELDLKYRSEGNILGSVQSGFKSSLRALKLQKDVKVIEESREMARALLAEDSTLNSHQSLRELVDELVGEDGVNWLARS